VRIEVLEGRPDELLELRAETVLFSRGEDCVEPREEISRRVTIKLLEERSRSSKWL